MFTLERGFLVTICIVLGLICISNAHSGSHANDNYIFSSVRSFLEIIMIKYLLRGNFKL